MISCFKIIVGWILGNAAMNVIVERIHNVDSASSYCNYSTQVTQVMHICRKPNQKLGSYPGAVENGAHYSTGTFRANKYREGSEWLTFLLIFLLRAKGWGWSWKGRRRKGQRGVEAGSWRESCWPVRALISSTSDFYRLLLLFPVTFWHAMYAILLTIMAFRDF